MATALNSYGTSSGVIKGGPMAQNKTKPQYRMPRLEEEDYVVRGRPMMPVPWFQAPGSEPWKRNLTLLADYQRILRKEERQASKAEELAGDNGVVSQDKKPMTSTALGNAGTGLGQGDAGSGMGGGENEKKGDRGSFAMPKKLEPRHRRLLQRIKRMQKRALPPKPPAALAPYQYQGSTGYTPTAAQSSTVRSGGIQGTILG